MHKLRFYSLLVIIFIHNWTWSLITTGSPSMFHHRCSIDHQIIDVFTVGVREVLYFWFTCSELILFFFFCLFLLQFGRLIYIIVSYLKYQIWCCCNDYDECLHSNWFYVFMIATSPYQFEQLPHISSIDIWFRIW